MKTRVLVIDDDQDHREVLAEALTYYHFKVKVGDSGKDLKRILMTFRPSLLLLDYRLPGENGIELCKKIKDDYKISGLPIIIMSAYPLGSENLEDCDYILHKPFDLDLLIDHVNDLVTAYQQGKPDPRLSID